MGQSSVIAMIPARLGSVRFPGKVLADATGKPLIQHVAEAAARSARVSRVVIATDDERVRARVVQFGVECVMTRADHPNGTSRLAEASDALGLSPGQIVVNVQGDEPELEPALIDAAVDALQSSGAPVATVATPLAPADARDPNVVKVVRRLDGAAMYFSRAAIPFDRDGAAGPDAAPLRHVGLYAYRREFLTVYRSLSPAPLEHVEKLEQLRVLEHGYAIAVAVCDIAELAPGIDTREQYEAFVSRWKSRQSEPRRVP